MTTATGDTTQRIYYVVNLDGTPMTSPMISRRMAEVSVEFFAAARVDPARLTISEVELQDLPDLQSLPSVPWACTVDVVATPTPAEPYWTAQAVLTLLEEPDLPTVEIAQDYTSGSDGSWRPDGDAYVTLDPTGADSIEISDPQRVVALIEALIHAGHTLNEINTVAERSQE